MSRIVIALGGNALGNNPSEQQALIGQSMDEIAKLIKEGHEIVLSHGNGPQVGIINLAFEDSYENKDIPYMPFAECTAMSQGYIGYHLQKGLKKSLKKISIDKDIATIVTQVLVDEDDTSFANPTKPVGPFYTKEVALELMDKNKETYIEDSGRGYRKVVASPKPIEIVEIATIEKLLELKCIVIAGGGGGIPIFKQNGEGANAVIDKDLVSSLMASKLNSDVLLILTNIEQAQLYYKTEQAVKLNKVSIAEMEKYISEGHFAKGSMLPKIEAAMQFVENTNGRAIITSLSNVANALTSDNVTEIIR